MKSEFTYIHGKPYMKAEEVGRLLNKKLVHLYRDCRLVELYLREYDSNPDALLRSVGVQDLTDNISIFDCRGW